MKKRKFKSLRNILSFFIVLIMLFLVATISFLSFKSSFDALEELYINQLMNINSAVRLQIESYLDQQLKAAKELASLDTVKQTVLTGKSSSAAEELVRNKFTTFGHYEEVFISTSDKNPVIIVSGNGKQAGLHWAGKGFDENIENNLLGKAFVSSPMKSPSGKTVVSAVTAPVIVNGRVVGIVGLPLDLGRFSQMMIHDIHIGKTGYTLLADKNGVIFSHPNEKYILTLKMKEHDWGKTLMEMPPATHAEYTFEGKKKYAHKLISENFDIMYLSTGYVSDVYDKAIVMVIKIAVTAFIIMIAAAISVYLFIKKRLKPLEQAKNLADELATGDGDLTRRIEVSSEDEIGELVHSFNTFIRNTHDLILNIKTGASALTEAVNEIASGNENLSQRTSEQASSLEEIASTIEETTANIGHNSENASQAKEVSEDTMKLAREGGEIVSKAVKAITGLSESSNRISEIINVINDIAFQTNLLALNASVESARAGEQGRGFAVVAGEVRNLSQRTANSSKEIASLIGDSLEKVSVSTDYSSQSGKALQNIIESLKRVSNSVEEIYSSSLEQKQGMEQINTAIIELDGMTQNNASMVEETASASEMMSKQSMELMEQIQRFKLDESGIEIMKLPRPAESKAEKKNAAGDKTKASGKKPLEKHKEHKTAADDEELKSFMSDEGFEEF